MVDEETRSAREQHTESVAKLIARTSQAEELVRESKCTIQDLEIKVRLFNSGNSYIHVYALTHWHRSDEL